MYIQTYQIDNVLNEYHKRLSQTPGTRERHAAARQEAGGSVRLSRDSRRQAIIEQVSANLVEQITQFGPKKNFADTLAAYMRNAQDAQAEKTQQCELEFVYTSIDENNRKSTQTLPIDNLTFLMGPSDHMETKDESSNDG